ncbi:hypothetical protein Ahy_B03g067967 isoform A [Arachis hypogaea]|uniref:HMA domain-containing protein n=1 Tax=Arachis hypogaea TaxID=3818 RepID=A0A445A8C4_ARAHY|nr:hypothetical protein Ahy_B03g067967 isoform A [Arachis hypogaea]
MGALDHISDLFDCSHSSSKLKKKRKQFQTVEVKVKMDCEGCERKVKKSVEGMKGVTNVEVERKANKVTVQGYVEPSKVVARIGHRTGKRAELWPYVPYDVVAHPYAQGVYDKKAPAGYVRNTEFVDPNVSQLARASSAEVRESFGGKTERAAKAKEKMAEEEYDDDVEEEFSVWKRNTPLLYDLVISHPLPWPSLTVHWLHSSPQPHSHPSFNLHKILYATHTSNSEPNYLILANVALPANPSQPVAAAVDAENPVLPKVEVTQRIMVDGEVNRARSMPQNPSVVASKTCGSEVYVFDVEKQHGKEQGSGCDPDLRLRGHDKEGYGLSWSPFKKGYLLSGSHDSKICVWDVLAADQDNVLDAIHVFEAHDGVVGDVSWHSKHESLFGSVGDDCKLIIWDLRTNKAQQSVKAHENEVMPVIVNAYRVFLFIKLIKLVNFISFNPYNEWIVATASSDTTIALFDTRKLAEPLHVLSSHTDEVYQVEWDPNHETVLASSGADRRLNVWDLSRVGDEQNEGDGDGGPPELLFSHGGHKGKISDFSWNKNQPWVISSVAEDNSFHVWQMAENIYNEDGDDEDIWTADGQN